MEPKLVAEYMIGYGLTVRPDVITIISDHYQSMSGRANTADYFKELVKAIRDANPELAFNPIVDYESISKVIVNIQPSQAQKEREDKELDEYQKLEKINNNSIFIKNSFPKYSEKHHTSIMSEIDDFYTVYKHRLVIIEKILVNHYNYSRIPSENTHLLAYTNGLAGLKHKCNLLGVLHQKSYGHYFLEDMLSAIEIDISGASLDEGFICEGQIVLAYGYIKGIDFYVEKLSHPPIITKSFMQARKEKSIRNDGINVIHQHQTKESNICMPLTINTQEVVNKETSMIIVINKVNLCSQKVIQSLASMFKGLEEMRPYAVIMMGEFANQTNDAESYKQGFDNLAKLISKYVYLNCNAKWIFIPSIDDIGINEVLPRFPLCEYITKAFTKKVKNAVFASNPMKMFYYGVELLFCSYNIYKDMKRSCLKLPSKGDDATNIAATIMAQQSLSPLIYYDRPTLWKYDEAITFNYVPDFIIAGDNCSEFTVKKDEAEFINPGNFSRDSTFAVIFPYSKASQPSRVNVENNKC